MNSWFRILDFCAARRRQAHSIRIEKIILPGRIAAGRVTFSMSPQAANQLSTLIVLVAVLGIVVLIFVVLRWLLKKAGLASGSKGLMFSLWVMGAIFCITLLDALHGDHDARVHLGMQGAIIAGICTALNKLRSR